MAKERKNEDIRINKFISDSGFCSRRDADQLIADERVTINGELAVFGSRVAEGDKVKIDGETLQFVPMEMREYKLRRYSPPRRTVQSEGEKDVKRQFHQERQPEGRLQAGMTGRGDSRKGRGEERNTSTATNSKPERSRLKSKSGRSADTKSSTRSMLSSRGKSATSVKPFSREKRKK